MESLEHYYPLIATDCGRVIDEVGDIVARDPSRTDALELLTRASYRALDLERCVEAGRVLLALDPGNELRAFVCHALMMLGRPAEALEVCGSSPAETYTRGVLHHRLGDLPQAMAAFGRCLAAYPQGDYRQAPALFGAMRVSRDQGADGQADDFARTLQGMAGPGAWATVSSALVDRHQLAGYPEWSQLADKARLVRTLGDGPIEAWFPRAFALPQDAAALDAYARARPPGTIYIAKPAHGSGGQGITIGPDLAALARPGVVVQRYLSRPFLMDGRKNHVRLYALVTSAAPLRAYLYGEGIVRLASEPYEAEGFDRSMRHITNTGLNGTHPDFWLSDDPAQEDAGSARSLTALLRRLDAAGHSAETIRRRLHELVSWFFRKLVRDGFFERQAAAGPSRAFPPKLIGFDVLIDADGLPWLLEMQTAPGIVPAAWTQRLHAEICLNIFRMTVAPGAPEAEAEVRNLGRFEPIAVPAA